MSIRNIIHFMGGIVKCCVRHTHGRGPVNVNSIFLLQIRGCEGRRWVRDSSHPGRSWRMTICGQVENSGRAFQIDIDWNIAQRSEGQHGQGTLKPIVAWTKSTNGGWFFLRKPQISVVATIPHADKQGWLGPLAFKNLKIPNSLRVTYD